ncbi:MAG: HEAT repeat domain-containing protein [Methanomicrobiales archaeon]|nr:HEAT repeat domain-containing protein [Methanomicrobiales archaeon]
MRIADLLARGTPDIDTMADRRDIDGLVKALGHRDTSVQIRAARALGALGPEAVDTLIRALATDDRDLRLGIIEAMGEIRDPSVLDHLLPLLHDRSNEVRWAAALALGQLGDREAVPLLVRSLQDPDRYVRYGAAISLGQLGWEPDADQGRACLALALQDWDRLASLGKAALPALQLASTDRDREVRARAVAIMGQIGDPSSGPALIRALADPDETVRWNAVQAAKTCGVPPMQIPRGVARRPRVRKDPRVTALLNFLLPGLGYFYLGKWWGILVWQVDITATVWLFTITGEAPAYAALFPIYLLLAAHGYWMASRMPDL